MRYSLLAPGVAVTGIIMLVARLKEQAERARSVELSRDEIARVERRLGFFAEASAMLASSLDYMLTLRDLSRLVVPDAGRLVRDPCGHRAGDAAVRLRRAPGSGQGSPGPGALRIRLGPPAVRRRAAARHG